MPIIITPDSFDHWLQLKSEDVSSTEVSALFGISPYSTEFELFHQKLSGDIYTIEDNERMYCGRMMEDTIAQMASEQLGIKVRRLKTYFRHDTVAHMSSSFDYEIVGNLDRLQEKYGKLKGPGLLEIKNVDGLVYRNEWSEDEAPAHIEAQVQHQLEVSNRNWAIIACLSGGNSMHIMFRERNRKIGKAMCERINKFWEDIDKELMPEPNYEKDADFIIEMYSDDQGEPVDISEDISLRSMIVTYKELRARYSELESATKAIKAEVFHRVGNASKLISSDGLTVSMTKTKDTPPTVITEDMIGTEIGGREGYRQFGISQRKVK